MAQTTTKITNHHFFSEEGSPHQTQTLCLHGKASTGKGEGTRLTELPWVESQIKQKLGFTPYPGTLNIILTKESIRLKQQLEDAETIEITPEKGYCTAKLFKAQITESLKAAIILPQISNYPRDTIEIIASMSLREKLKLKDDDPITVEVSL